MAQEVVPSWSGQSSSTGVPQIDLELGDHLVTGDAGDGEHGEGLGVGKGSRDLLVMIHSGRHRRSIGIPAREVSTLLEKGDRPGERMCLTRAAADILHIGRSERGQRHERSIGVCSQAFRSAPIESMLGCDRDARSDASRGCVLMPDPDTILDSLERFAATLTGGYGIGDVLHNLTEEMAEVLDLTGAGVTSVHDGQQRFVTAAVDAIATLERVQENWQKGPCIDAVASAAPVAVPDIAADDAHAALAGLRHRCQDHRNPGRRLHPDAR